ncbi:hypothetical protein EJK51_0709 [Moraxella catarrhalis]|jgi:hypothetical protein|nr:hypothetical protein EJK52_0711 [Moraxella catarrhalis]EGE14666.1 hypothetical protein E9K_04297 [Moraxella catarrhalis 103P14B1]EGE25279.1 hypothetical protein E9W_05173 [Moraxella catarrhalis CO72]EGE26469.1 hypothetical protein E9Y_01050 [Moraxella catarrhalis 101P30B1]EKF84207.1 hypothetical protein MCRH_0741 [Moraxella catarrhalis RH4]
MINLKTVNLNCKPNLLVSLAGFYLIQPLKSAGKFDYLVQAKTLPKAKFLTRLSHTQR